MPIKVHLVLLTPDWKGRTVELDQRLRQLESSCPNDETCEIWIAEQRDDPLIHATIARRRRTMVWNDWDRNDTHAPASYKYESTFGPPDPSIDDIVDSVKRMLGAPEDS